MKAIPFSTSTGAMKYYLNAPTDHLFVGCGFSCRSKQTFVCIDVSYSLEELRTLVFLFAEMNREIILPEIYVWNENRFAPDIVIVFNVQNPSAKLLTEAIGYSSRFSARCASIFTLGRAKIEQRCIKKLLDIFGKNGGGIVTVTESTDTDSDDLNPLQIFRVTKIRREKPVLL